MPTPIQNQADPQIDELALKRQAILSKLLKNNAPAAHLAAVLNESGSDLIALQQVALEIDPDKFSQELKHCFTQFSQLLQQLQASRDPLAQEELVNRILQFVDAIAEISRDFKANLKARGLYQMQANKVMNDSNKMADLQRFFQAAFNQNALQQDITRALQQNLKQAHEAKKDFVQGLKKSIEPQREAYEKEITSKIQTAARSKDDNLPFSEDASRLGWMLWSFITLMLDYELKINPSLVYGDYKEEAENTFRKLNSQRYGSGNNAFVAPGAAPAPAPAAPAVKPGGPS